MATSSRKPGDRLLVGQLMARLLRELRRDLSARASADFDDIRDPHLQIFGVIGDGGIRLTEIAARSQLSLAGTFELVNDLQHLGYLERQPDPSDGRAKLICLTTRGKDLLAHARGLISDLEERWSAVVGDADFDVMCRTMQRLLDELDAEEASR